MRSGTRKIRPRDQAYEKAKEFGKLLREGAFDYESTKDEIEKAQRLMVLVDSSV
jgi:hypothetical protein